MNGYIRMVLLGLGLSLGFGAVAQTVNGCWYGIGTVRAEGDNSNYLAELKLHQRGKTVTGSFSYYFRDSLFTTPLTGKYDAVTRKLTIDPLPILYYRSADTKMGVDCYMSGQFTLLTSKTESILNGRFQGDNAHRYTVPDLNFRLRFSTDTASLAPESGEEAVAVAGQPVEAKADTPYHAPVDTVPVTQRQDFLSRPKTFVKELEISSPVIRVELYDNGTVDYDSVSLFLNDREILSKSMLTHKAIRLNITLDPRLAFNELSMYAENLGRIPPNTAAMIVYDGNTRHELILTSDLHKTATIRLKQKKTGSKVNN